MAKEVKEENLVTMESKVRRVTLFHHSSVKSLVKKEIRVLEVIKEMTIILEIMDQEERKDILDKKERRVTLALHK